jgi:predicted RNase H-like nuclease
MSVITDRSDAVWHVGVDLAWKVDPPGSNRTAVTVLDDGGRFFSQKLVTTDQEILDGLVGLGRRIHVGIDAPLVVANRTGRRRCEDELQRLGLTAYPANREWLGNRFGGVRGEKLVEQLEEFGFVLVDRHEHWLTRTVIEVFPYASWRRLFPEYRSFKTGSKSGRVCTVEEAARRLEWLIPGVMGSALRLVRDCASLKAVSQAGDLLDSAVAAWTTYLFHQSAGESCQVVGSLEPWDDPRRGFVVIPRCQT